MNQQQRLTTPQSLTYSSTAGVNPPVGFDRPINSRRMSAPIALSALFLCPQCVFMAAVRGTSKDVPVPGIRSVNLRTAVTQTCLTASGDGSTSIPGTITMNSRLLRFHAVNPSVIRRTKAHRAMALAALKSDSSLKNRLSRYNHHITKARQLENTGGAK